jgi:hypothetical protein
MEAEVLMCEVYGPLRRKCYAGFPPLRHFRFPFNLSERFVVHFTTLSESGSYSVDRMNDEFARVWKEAVVAYSRPCPIICMEGLKETTKSRCQESQCSVPESNSDITNTSEKRYFT